MILTKYRYICIVLLSIILLSNKGYNQIIDGISYSTDKLEIEFLGINLGCTLDELKEVLDNSPNKIKYVKKEIVKGMETYAYAGNHRLNDALFTSFSFWEGKLALVMVMYSSDEAKDIYDALKMKTEEKYSKMNDEISFSGESCTLTTDGMMLMLILNTSLSETNSVQFMAGHTGIQQAKDKKDLSKRAKSLGDF